MMFHLDTWHTGLGDCLIQSHESDVAPGANQI
jgi:hypothetical protein